MQGVRDQVFSLDPSLAFLLILAGLVYGLFGWRMVRYLVVLDSFVLAGVAGYAVRGVERIGSVSVPTLSVSIALVILIPLLAWRFQKCGAVVLSGLVGFGATLLFLAGFNLSPGVVITTGGIGAGIAIALAVTLFRPTTVVITALHGAWLCVAAFGLMAAHQSNFLGEMLHSYSHRFEPLAPISAAIFTIMLVAVQWSDSQREMEVDPC